jgi:outer membrane receptor protein involved in Fe transport
MLRKGLLLSAAPFFALLGAPVQAQQASASGAEESGPTLAPIVVTAQKREQALQDVPISIAALGAAELENQQINDLLDIVGDVPNVFINNFNGRPGVVRLFIRGLGQNDVSLTQDPSVALYTDGVYVGTSVGAAFELTDLERIEILRGPQGTLYGRNSTGGAINLIAAKPKLEEFGYKLSGSVGNFNYRNITGHVNIPLGETAAVKFSGLQTKRDGWIENTGKTGKVFAPPCVGNPYRASPSIIRSIGRWRKILSRSQTLWQVLRLASLPSARHSLCRGQAGLCKRFRNSRRFSRTRRRSTSRVRTRLGRRSRTCRMTFRAMDIT